MTKIGPITIGKKYTITDGTGSPYLTRYTLLDTPWFSIKLHKIIRSDGDRALHDHPWSFVSVILRGGYVEHYPAHCPPRFVDGEMLTDGQFYDAASIVFHRAEDLHRLEITPIPPATEVRPTWTLVFCGRKQREWGFATPQGWVQWERYLSKAAHERSTNADPVNN